MKRVLVIAYYFPPMGLSGVQRVLKFVKYLPDFGWQPTVLTVEPHAYFAFDDSLLDELKGRSVEIWRARPGRALALLGTRKTVPLKNERVRKFLSTWSQWFFIPDNKIGWKRQALKFLATRDLSSFDAVFSSAPPFSSHLIGLALKENEGLPLVTDFRDAWVDNPYHRYWTRWHKRRHQALEERVLAASDAIVSNNDRITTRWAERYAEMVDPDHLHIIPQGYDAEDFKDAGPLPDLPPDALHWVYTGVFYDRNHPGPLYDALAEVKRTARPVYDRLQFHMIGYVQDEYRRRAAAAGVGDRFVYHGYRPHAETVAWQRRADVLWLVLGTGTREYETVSSGKAYEYLGSGRPILAIGGPNTVRDLLSQFPHAFLAEPDDPKALAALIVRIADQAARGTLPKVDWKRIQPYKRRQLTARLAAILDGAARR